MRITHISDVHGDFERLERVASRDADVVAVTGDFLGTVLSEEDSNKIRDITNFIR